MKKFTTNDKLNNIVCEVLDTLGEVLDHLVDESERDTLKPVCFTLVTGYVTEDYWKVIEKEMADLPSVEADPLLERTPLEIGIHAFPIFRGEDGETEFHTGLELALLTKALKRIKSSNYNPKDTIAGESKKTVH